MGNRYTQRGTAFVEVNTRVWRDPINYIHEDMVADDAEELVYPSVSSCVVVLCVLADKLTGVHFTVSSDPKNVKLFFTKWAELNGDSEIESLYILGPHIMWSEGTNPTSGQPMLGMKFAQGADGVTAYF